MRICVLKHDDSGKFHDGDASLGSVRRSHFSVVAVRRWWYWCCIVNVDDVAAPTLDILLLSCNGGGCARFTQVLW